MITGKITGYKMEARQSQIHALGNLQAVSSAQDAISTEINVVAADLDLDELQKLAKGEVVLMSRKEYEDYMHFKLNKIIMTE